jgi:hypothetical protein
LLIDEIIIVATLEAEISYSSVSLINEVARKRGEGIYKHRVNVVVEDSKAGLIWLGDGNREHCEEDKTQDA